jgi:hypothetical protein
MTAEFEIRLSQSSESCGLRRSPHELRLTARVHCVQPSRLPFSAQGTAALQGTGHRAMDLTARRLARDESAAEAAT